MSANRKPAGFTLVEILIVVIILGILAAMVIPQFTDASESAKKNSLISQVQTIRSQLELYKSAHSTVGAGKVFVTGTGTDKAQWQELLGKTDSDGAVSASGAYGPYLQSLPVNNINGKSNVIVSASAIDELTYTAGTAGGFVYDQATGKFWALDKNGTKVYTGN